MSASHFRLPLAGRGLNSRVRRQDQDGHSSSTGRGRATAPHASIQTGPDDVYLVFGRNVRFVGAPERQSTDIRIQHLKYRPTAGRKNRRPVQGNIAYFGTYSVNEADVTGSFTSRAPRTRNWYRHRQLRLVTGV